MQDQIIIFSDGSSSGNPGPGGWGSIVIYPEKTRNDEVVELGGGERQTTNNRMELQAVISALESIGKTDRQIVVYTDSMYLINGITKWVFGWKARGWITLEKKSVANSDLWEKLHALCVGKKIDWKKVDGHSGIAGNERVDEIATDFTRGKPSALYHGLRKNYSVRFGDMSKCETKVASKNRTGAKAFSYLSLVGGEFNIDKTWDVCSARVKGKAGAKYRKALSAEDEELIKKSWGIK
jgi:ribonuclease HI